jgi:dihydroorotase
MAGEIHLPVDRLVAAMSTNPARILGVSGGRLAVGDVADITIVDPLRRWTVDPAQLQSKSRNTPFGGMQLQGQAVATIVGGRVVWRAEDPGERPATPVRA